MSSGHPRAARVAIGVRRHVLIYPSRGSSLSCCPSLAAEESYRKRDARQYKPPRARKGLLAALVAMYLGDVPSFPRRGQPAPIPRSKASCWR